MLSSPVRSSWLFAVVMALLPGPLAAATYYVDQASAGASDKNPGTQAAPWKTISRAAGAKELKPGDTVLIGSGVYRETVRHHGLRRAGKADHLCRRSASAGGHQGFRDRSAAPGPG